MTTQNSDKSALFDVALGPPGPDRAVALEEVGMEGVEIELLRDGSRIPARAQAAVSLINPDSRGIHMSRLFKLMTRLREQELSWPWLEETLREMLASQSGLSDRGHLQVSLEWTVLRPALISGELGWRSYPLRWRVDRGPSGPRRRLSLEVLYSSTCPCSAAISRQAVQDEFRREFQGRSPAFSEIMEWLGRASVAVPHSQRSLARVDLELLPEVAVASGPVEWIDRVEKALGTAVQAAVKREDEQEFARLNARHQMFCEDAARSLYAALIRARELRDFCIEVRHFESLHPHDVVARVSKGQV